MTTIPPLGQFVSHARMAAPRQDRTVPAWAIVSAGLTPILLTGGWLVAGTLQPVSYDPIRDTVSVMAGHAGTDRWVMTGALLLVGGCHLVTAAGLGAIRLSARVLLILAGLSSIGIALCPEPIAGSTPQHLAWTSFGAVIITIWPAFTARPGSPQPLIVSRQGSAAVTVMFLVLLCWLVIETQGGSYLGMAERLTSAVQTSWPFVVAVVLWRHAAQTGLPGLPGEPADAQPITTEAVAAEAMGAEAMATAAGRALVHAGRRLGSADHGAGRVVRGPAARPG